MFLCSQSLLAERCCCGLLWVILVGFLFWCSDFGLRMVFLFLSPPSLPASLNEEVCWLTPSSLLFSWVPIYSKTSKLMAPALSPSDNSLIAYVSVHPKPNLFFPILQLYLLSDSLLIQPEGFLEEVVSEMNHERLGEEGDKHWEGAKA